MNDPVRDGFEYIKQSKIELDYLIMGRNDIARWSKLNQKKIPLALNLSQEEYS